MLMYSQTSNVFFFALSVLFLSAITVIILLLTFKTLRSISRNEICVED